MSIKRYCDLCEKEMANPLTIKEGRNNLGRLTATIERNGTRLRVEVMHSQDDCANKGDVCNYCILDALAALDDRPKQKSEQP